MTEWAVAYRKWNRLKGRWIKRSFPMPSYREAVACKNELKENKTLKDLRVEPAEKLA